MLSRTGLSITKFSSIHDSLTKMIRLPRHPVRYSPIFIPPSVTRFRYKWIWAAGRSMKIETNVRTNFNLYIVVQHWELMIFSTKSLKRFPDFEDFGDQDLDFTFFLRQTEAFDRILSWFHRAKAHFSSVNILDSKIFSENWRIVFASSWLARLFWDYCTIPDLKLFLSVWNYAKFWFFKVYSSNEADCLILFYRSFGFVTIA